MLINTQKNSSILHQITLSDIIGNIYVYVYLFIMKYINK
jgi:hypothetical protein